MFVRSNLNKKKMITVNYIHSRWLLRSRANRPDEEKSGDDVSCSAFRVLDSHLRSSKHSVLNGSTKWRTSTDIAQRVVESMSSQDTSTFLGLAKALRTVEEYAAQGVVPSIEPGALTADKDARCELNSDDQDLQSNDESTVSATIKTEEEADDCNKGSSLEDQLVKNTHPLVKSTNRLVKKDNRLVKSPGSLTVRKRGSDDKASCDLVGVSSTSEEERRMFEVISSTKSKGRPKIKKQQREAKRLRMEDSKHQANVLVQRTLVPVKDLALVRKTLECSFNVSDALPVLLSITPVDAPAWKSTSIIQIARKRKVQCQVTIVFPKNFLVKCIDGIKMYRKSLPGDHNAGNMGVSIAKLGTYAEKDLVTMKMWREKLPKLESFSDLVSWIRLSIFSRLSLSPPLNNCTNVDTKACATRLETINLKRTVKSRFGNIAVHEIAAFRRSQLLDDACIMLVLSNMVDRDRVAYPRVGIGAVNPLFMTMADDEVKRDVIEHSLPFQTENKVVPIPIHLEAHWAGVVFNYNDNKLVYFDPMQSKANYDSMEASTSAKIKCGFVIIRQRAPRQQDTTSCGPLTLLFFDCMVVGILVSNVQPESIPYLRFRFLYLSCQNIFCDGTESNTEIDVV